MAANTVISQTGGRPPKLRAALNQRRTLARITNRRLLIQLVLSGLTVAFVVGSITARVSGGTAVDIAAAYAVDQSMESARALVEPVLSDAAVSGDQVAYATLDQVVRAHVAGDSLVGVKLWRADGTVVYSTEPRLVGKQFALGAREMELFTGGSPVAAVSDLSAPENEYEAGERLLEVYLLTSTGEGTPLLYETYYEYSGVSAVANQLTHQITPIAIAAALIAVLIQIPMALTRVGPQSDRDRLVAHAIAASDAERRRIAEDLHHGPLQSLVASSMSVAAASHGADAPDATLDAASIGIVESMQSLRSLLVDLAPPELHDGSLESALRGLLRRLEERSVATEFAVESDGTPVGENTARLLYWTAQELVRDALAASDTPSIRCTLRIDRWSLELIVADNRPNEEAEERYVSPAASEPTTMLDALSDLIADAGGSLTTSGRSLGHSTRVQLPLLGHSDLVFRQT